MEGETKITTVEKVKDPRRVVQGKKLAAISREAKARRAVERERVKECVDNANMLYLAVGATAVVGLAYGAYRYLYTTKDVKEDPVLQPNVANEVSKRSVVENKVSRLERL